MNNMQEALTEALEHPLEYHRPKPQLLRRQPAPPATSSGAWMWSVVGILTGIALLARLKTR